MINFTVGPVQSPEEVLKIGGEQVPYFRNQEFSDIMLENERLIKKFAKAKEEDKVVFITGSGTASMEACVMSLFDENDKLLVINGGSFGQRFVDLCTLHELNFDQIKLNFGHDLKKEEMEEYNGKGYTGLLVNLHETSSGEKYNIEMLSEFCKNNNMFLLVDSISSFLADEFDFAKLGVGAMITGSQKALSCYPGISVIILSQKAIERINRIPTKCMYLDLKNHLVNMERGQTPFTPAVSVLRQINARLKAIEAEGGVEVENKRTAELAKYFRDGIKDLPLEIVAENCSNAVTALRPRKKNATEIIRIIKEDYKMWICPNGGEKKDEVFRVGHIGHLTKADFDKLLKAFHELNEKGIL